MRKGAVISSVRLSNTLMRVNMRSPTITLHITGLSFFSTLKGREGLLTKRERYYSRPIYLPSLFYLLSFTSREILKISPRKYHAEWPIFSLMLVFSQRRDRSYTARRSVTLKALSFSMCTTEMQSNKVL